jgi:uncharacterized membrane protein
MMEAPAFFDKFVIVISDIVALIGVGIIGFGALKAGYNFLLSIVGKRAINVNYVRVELGYSIILGLEFMVGSDIIESMVKPNYYEVGILGLLVLIRTFLSYFLYKELEQVSKEESFSSK